MTASGTVPVGYARQVGVLALPPVQPPELHAPDLRAARAVAQRLVDDLERIYGERLECGVLYGSVARGEHIEGESDVNVMVLLDNIDAATLAQAAPVAQRWAREGHTPPLIMEREQWQRASDVFAIELADMLAELSFADRSSSAAESCSSNPPACTNSIARSGPSSANSGSAPVSPATSRTARKPTGLRR